MIDAAQIRLGFGKWLKSQIKVSGHKNRAIADIAGIHEVTLSRILSGKMGIKRATVSALSKALNLDLKVAMAMAGYNTGEVLPPELAGLPFEKLDSPALGEIRSFIEFKLAQKEGLGAARPRTVAVSKIYVKKPQLKHTYTGAPKRG